MRLQLLGVCAFDFALNVHVRVTDIIMYMPQLPDRQTYERLRTECRRNLDRRIDHERPLAAKASPLSTVAVSLLRAHNLRNLQSPIAKVVSPNNKAATHVAADGWTAETKVLPRMFSSNPFEDADDDPLQPLKEQIVIIRGCVHLLVSRDNSPAVCYVRQQRRAELTRCKCWRKICANWRRSSTDRRRARWKGATRVNSDSSALFVISRFYQRFPLSRFVILHAHRQV